MKNGYIDKINKMGQAGHTIAKICTVILYIAAVCCIVATALLALVPSDSVMVTTSHQAEIEMDVTHSIMPNLVGIDAEADGSFELNGIKYDQFDITGTLSRQYAVAKSTPYTYSLKNMMRVTFSGCVLCITLILAFRKISALFNIFKVCETPFSQETADYFKKIIISFIPVMIMTLVVETATKWVTTGLVDITIGIDLTAVMAVIVMLMMAEIFRYGAMLQTESDETL